MTAALFGLEQNWGGDILSNEHVLQTLSVLQAVEEAAAESELRSNWRLQMYIYRGYFDAVVQAEYRAQQSSEDSAREALATAPSVGTSVAITAAITALNHSGDDPRVLQWKARMYQVRDMINVSVGTEVLQGQDTALNLDGVYLPLNDKVHNINNNTNPSGYPLRPCTTPFPEEKSILRVI